MQYCIHLAEAIVGRAALHCIISVSPSVLKLAKCACNAYHAQHGHMADMAINSESCLVLSHIDNKSCLESDTAMQQRTSA